MFDAYTELNITSVGCELFYVWGCSQRCTASLHAVLT